MTEQQRKAMEMALKFIVVSSAKDKAWYTAEEFEVVAALREALAQPEQEPETVMAKYEFQTYAAYKDDGEIKIGVVPEPTAWVTAGKHTVPLEVAPVDAVNISQERVDETVKNRHEYVNDRERLEAIVSVICRYLPPGGTDIKSAMSEIIALVDPLPPKREWVGLTDEEAADLWADAHDIDGKMIWTPAQLFEEIERRLKEKNA